MDAPFDYSEVPFDFGMCAAENCPSATTCLRQIALKHTPENILFPQTLNPLAIKKGKGKCKYYKDATKVLNAVGFMRTVNALTLCVADTFRNRMIAYLGRKNYYLKRKGKLPLSLSEQKKGRYSRQRVGSGSGRILRRICRVIQLENLTADESLPVSLGGNARFLPGKL